MANDINALRDALFQTLTALRDPYAPMELERAEAVAHVAQTLINSAKVELEFVKHAGGTGSGFVPLTQGDSPGAILAAPNQAGAQTTTQTQTIRNGAQRTVTELGNGVTVTRNTLR